MRNIKDVQNLFTSKDKILETKINNDLNRSIMIIVVIFSIEEMSIFFTN